METTFSADEEELLIELVRTFPALYNTQDALYKDNGAKCNAWKKIARQIDKKEDVCKTKWKHIRDWYSRKKKEGKLPTGSGVLGTHLRSRYERLAFLDCYGESRLSFSDIAETKEAVLTATMQNDTSTTANSIAFENGEMDQSNESQEENAVCSSEEQSTLVMRALRKRPIRQQILLDRGKAWTANLKLIREIVQQVSSVTPQHPVDDFFRAMSSIVKQLPADLQVQVKQEISNIVLSAESQIVSGAERTTLFNG